MVNPSLPPEQDINSNLASFLGENQAIRWVSENGKLFVGAIFGCILAAFLGASLLGHKNQEKDYRQAEQNYLEFQKETDANLQQVALDKLNAILKSYPNLQARYGGLIGQILLNRHHLTQALPYIEQTLKRTEQDHLSFYAAYAQTTLTLCQEKFSQALEEAKSLRDRMINFPVKEESKQFGDYLYLFNLMRIALVYQQMQNNGEELQAWQIFKQAPVQTSHQAYVLQPDSFEYFIKQLQDGSSSLLDYIQNRELTLKSKV